MTEDDCLIKARYWVENAKITVDVDSLAVLLKRETDAAQRAAFERAKATVHEWLHKPDAAISELVESLDSLEPS